MSSSASGFDAAELAPWLLDAEARLTACGAPHALIGGAVVQLYGLRARTRDVDFLVDVPAARFEALAAALEVEGLRVERKAPWHLRAWRGDLYADVLLAEMELQRAIVARADRRMVVGRDMPVATPEDMIVLKVLAGRPRDRRDVADILESMPTLDHARIRSALAEFGLTWDPPPV